MCVYEMTSWPLFVLDILEWKREFISLFLPYRCPQYTSVPAGCTLETDPNDPCCRKPVCVSLPTPAPSVTLAPNPLNPNPTPVIPTLAPPIINGQGRYQNYHHFSSLYLEILIVFTFNTFLITVYLSMSTGLHKSSWKIVQLSFIHRYKQCI